MTMDWNEYKQVTNYLYNLKGRYKKQGLKNIKKLLEMLDNPHKELKNIHVGGTKGKGSVAVMIGSILHSEGYKVGLSTSPHLIEYTERIKINGKEISKNDILKYINKIRPCFEKMINLGYEPSFFEITTALALKYFHDKKVDFVVIEVGVGGRFDATNVVEPLVSLITNSSLDHEHVLGNSVYEIAKEEAGIIKNGCIAVTASDNDDVINIYKTRCSSENVQLIIVGKDIIFKRLNYDLKSQTFSVNGISNIYDDCKLNLLGKHQIVNASTAIGAIEALITKGIKVSKSSIYNGLEKTIWKGRLDIIKNNPLVILDGAHNVDSAQKLKETLIEITELNNFGKIIFIVGIFQDKDLDNILKIFGKIGDILIATRAKTDRSADAQTIADIGKYYFKQINIKEDVEDAIKYALKITNKNDIICVSGSLYVVAEALKSNINTI